MSLIRRVYCAGPLFSESERTEMAAIAQHLETAGFSTFLPHRDGLEFAKVLPSLVSQGSSPRRAAEMLSRAVFSLDVFELLVRADAVVANLNGRVPDEGTVVEATLAWHSGKPLVLFKDDVRTSLDGSDNPMLLGLGRFQTVQRLDEIVRALRVESEVSPQTTFSCSVEHGKKIAELRATDCGNTALIELINSLFSTKLTSR